MLQDGLELNVPKRNQHAHVCMAIVLVVVVSVIMATMVPNVKRNVFVLVMVLAHPQEHVHAKLDGLVLFVIYQFVSQLVFMENVMAQMIVFANWVGLAEIAQFQLKRANKIHNRVS